MTSSPCLAPGVGCRHFHLETTGASRAYRAGVPEWPRPPLPLRWTAAVQPTFVGRRHEVRAIAGAWSAAAEGARQTLFVGGEPGAGKSRLVAEACADVHGRGGTVLLGTCRAGLGSPYQPFLEPVQQLLPALTRGDLAVARPPSERTRLLELLATTLDGGQRGRRGADHQRELYDAVVVAIVAAAGAGPLALVLEDMHWAGLSAVRLLTYLVERTASLPLLLLVTHRSTAPDRSDALVQAMGRLQGVDGVGRLDLPPLATDDIADYLVAEAGGSRGQAAVIASRLRQLTGGNAFFLRELWRSVAGTDDLAALRSGSGSVRPPDSVRDAVDARLGCLAPSRRQLVETAAVIGDDVDAALLLATAPDLADATAALDAAVALRLLEPGADTAGVFRFPHALTRQAVLDLTPWSRRADLHAHIAQLLEERFPSAPERVQRLAHHYESAHALGHAGKAVIYLEQAAATAAGAMAHAESAGLLERAATLACTPEDRDRLLLAAAARHLAGGNFARSKTIAEGLATTSDTTTRLRAATCYELACFRTGQVGHRALQLLAAAVDRADAEAEAAADPSVVRALAALARALAYTGADEQSVQHGERAIALASGMGDGVLAVALQTSLWTPLVPATAAAKLARAEQACAVAARARDLPTLGAASYLRAIVAYAVGDAVGWHTACSDVWSVSRQTGEDFFSYMAGCLDVGRHILSGDLAAAERASEAVRALAATTFGSDDADGPYAVQMFMVRREAGLLEQVRPLLTGEEDVAGHWAPGLLALYTELAMQGPAARVLSRLLGGDLSRQRASAQWPAVLVFLVEAALLLRDGEALERLRPLLAEYDGVNLVAGGFEAAFGSAGRYLGMVDSALGRGAPEETFAAALALDTAMGAPLHQAETLARLAAHRARRGDRAGAADAAERATGLAAPRGLRRVRRLAEQALRLPAGRSPAPQRRAAGPDGVTARELEVLALLTDGLSNREIAERLVISESTAENHVRSILRKTGSSNRTQAARYATKQGLD